MENSKHELYYRRQMGRPESGLKHFLWGIFSFFESYGRMLLEVFIRKDFGERYFRISTAVATVIFLALWPWIWLAITAVYRALTVLQDLYQDPSQMPTPSSFLVSFLIPYIGWYIFLALFLLRAIEHHKAQKRNPSVFDFARYSRDSGRILPVFWEISLFGKRGDPRIIECWLEPMPFFFVGAALALIGQSVGWLLILSSLVYAISYRSAYNHGDNFVMDMIDERIRNEGLYKSFVEDADPSETRGYRFMGRKPNDPEKRKAVVGAMLGEDDDIPLAK